MTKSSTEKGVFAAVKETTKALINELLSDATKALRERRVGDAGNFLLSIDVLLDLYLKADEASKK